MPSGLIRGVRSVELATTNLEEAARFYETVWMLEPAETRNAARYVRGTAGYHHILGLHVGAQPAVIRIAFISPTANRSMRCIGRSRLPAASPARPVR